MDQIALGKRIKAAREKACMTQEELAAAVDYSVDHMSVVERGVKAPKLEKLVAIANALNIGTDELLQDDLNTATMLHAKELPEKPEYLFRLTLGLHPDLEDDRTVTLELPASAEALREVQKQLGADGWEGAMVLDYDGIIPQAAEFADLPMELDAFNDFAEAVEAMPSREKQIPKLKALLEHFEVTDLATAAGLAEHIGDYILTPEISSPQEAAIDELNFTMDAHSAELLLPHVNLFTYGNEIIKDDNAALTSYGLLHREDYQPMQTPV